MGDNLTPLQEPYEAALRELEAHDAIVRLWARDHTLWSDRADEISNRLGWLDSPGVSRQAIPAVQAFAADVRDGGFTDIVVLGMGGSSLGPDALARSLDSTGPALHALDTTNPDEIRALEAAIDPARTLFVVASKSGTTVETRSHFEYFWAKYPNPGHFVAITDSGSALERLARDRNLRKIFLNPPDIGGRYATFSLFGLVPAATTGVDVTALLESAARGAEGCRAPGVGRNPAARVAALLAAAARSGRDKLTLLANGATWPLAEWIEQILAESLGKDGRGIVPILREPPDSERLADSDRIVAVLGANTGAGPLPPNTPAIHRDADDLGAEMFHWQVITALTAHLLGVQPFNQPDVEAAKEAARNALTAAAALPVTAPAAEVVGAARRGDYVAVLAYLGRTDANQRALDAVASVLRKRTGCAVTTAFGPRYLHSTGQLHKGGPPSGRFLVILPEFADDISIPGESFTFGELQLAQAAGDVAALEARGLPVAITTLQELAALGE